MLCPKLFEEHKMQEMPLPLGDVSTLRRWPSNWEMWLTHRKWLRDISRWRGTCAGAAGHTQSICEKAALGWREASCAGC